MGEDLAKAGSLRLPADAAAHYDHFFGPLYFEPYAIEVAKLIDPARVSMVLELAAGTGRVTRRIRERISPSANFIASDIDNEMLAIAKDKLKQLDIEWQNINAQDLPFEDNSIDLVVCCFGFMFVHDRPKAFSEVYRVLKPGGQFLFTTWDSLEHNAASYISRSIAERYFDGPFPRSYNLATSMSDEAAIKTLLINAGFSKMSIKKKGLFSTSATAKEAASGLVIGGYIYEEIKKRDPALIDKIRSEVEKELAEKFGAAPMIAPMSALICEAWK